MFVMLDNRVIAAL